MKLTFECQTANTDTLVITINKHTQQVVFNTHSDFIPGLSIILNNKQTSELIRFLQTHLTKILLKES